MVSSFLDDEKINFILFLIKNIDYIKVFFYNRNTNEIS